MDTQLLSRLVMLGAAGETHGAIGSIVEAYRSHGVFKRWPVEYLATHNGGGFVDNAALTARALKRFAMLLAEHRRVGIHLHTTARPTFWRDCVFLGIAAAARCPAVVQLHGGGFDAFYDEASPAGRAAIRFALEHAERVVVPTDALRAWIRSVTRVARVESIPSPVTLPPPVPQSERHDMVLFLGRLEIAKGVYELLEAVAAVRPAAPDLRLVCAGEGDRPAVARYAERLGIAEAVKFTGWVGPSGKRALLETASVFVLPSYSAGLPQSVLEAMAAGVPVIASPIGGIPEVLVDGVTGFLVSPGDTATLSRLLRKLLTDRALAARIGTAARESVRLRFSPDRTIPQIEEIYAEIGVTPIGRTPRKKTLPELKEAA